MHKSFSPIEFLTERGQFRNQHGVSVLLLEDFSVHVGCDYPDAPCPQGCTLEIVKLYENEEAFLTGLQIDSKIELNAFTPLYMLRKYEEGKMDVSCLVEKERVAGLLIFRKYTDMLLAIDQDSGRSHRVEKVLRFGSDYLAYTAANFHL